MNLRILRLNDNKTQEETASIFHLTQGTYSNYEIEKTDPPIDILIKFADYYGVTLDYLVGRKFNNEVSFLNDQETYLLNLFKELKQDSKFKVIGYIESELTR